MGTFREHHTARIRLKADPHTYVKKPLFMDSSMTKKVTIHQGSVCTRVTELEETVKVRPGAREMELTGKGIYCHT